MKFNADSVMPLTTFINKQGNKKGTNYNVILHFIGNIGNQLTFLRNKGYSIPFFSLEDFIVIDNVIFSFINDDKIFKIDDETKNITVDYPIRYNKNHSFIPPGLAFGLDEQPNKIPIDIYYSSIYYSLAQLCVYIFLRKQINFFLFVSLLMSLTNGPFYIEYYYYIELYIYGHNILENI